MFAWAKFMVGHRAASISAIRRSRCRTSIFGGKTIVQRTSAGTQGIVAAANQADRLYAASLVTADATVRALLSGSPDQISLVAMGDNGLKRTDEDELCAIHLRNRLKGRPGDPDAIRRLILAGGEVRRFRDPSRMSTSPSTSTGTISRSGSTSRMAVRLLARKGRPDADGRRTQSRWLWDVHHRSFGT
jgi:2-phosphosulfolactate phosphatase